MPAVRHFLLMWPGTPAGWICLGDWSNPCPYTFCAGGGTPHQSNGQDVVYLFLPTTLIGSTCSALALKPHTELATEALFTACASERLTLGNVDGSHFCTNKYTQVLALNPFYGRLTILIFFLIQFFLICFLIPKHDLFLSSRYFWGGGGVIFRLSVLGMCYHVFCISCLAGQCSPFLKHYCTPAYKMNK